jgi:HSP20 family molecular chaperone IbpA
MAVRELVRFHRPVVDITEDDEAYKIAAELPGISDTAERLS